MQSEEKIESTSEPLFFAYASRWYIDLNEAECVDPEYWDISSFELPNDYLDEALDSKLNIFIVSLSGKPLYYRYGEDDNIIPLLGVAYTLFVTLNEENIRDTDNFSNIMLIQGDKQMIVFFAKPPLLFITLASICDIEAIKISVNQQLSLIMRVRDFIISVVTQKLLYNAYQKYKNFNFNKLLAGSEKIFNSWLHRLDTDLCVNLNCIKYLYIISSYRNAITKLLWQYIHTKNVVFTILMYKSYIVSCIQQEPYILTPHDLHILINMIMTSSSFKSSEITCTPICLPNFNSNSFLHAHISYLDPNKRYCLIFLTSEHNAFQKLSESQMMIMKNFHDKGHLDILNEWICNKRRHIYTVDDLFLHYEKVPQEQSLIHFIYIVKPGNYVTAPVFPTHSNFNSQYRPNISNNNVISCEARRHIFCAYLYLRFRMNPISTSSTDMDESFKITTTEFSNAFNSDFIRTFSRASSTLSSNNKSSPQNIMSSQINTSSPNTANSPLQNLVGNNYNLIDALTSSYNTPPSNLGLSFLSISTKSGISVGWRDLKYELYAHFNLKTSPDVIQETKELILKWVHREYRSLFPVNQ